ncbi:hypothetical protein GALMADRAFT_145683 [Galerina marginata CBS 339.88]|uniref:Uncharacterized protein n=1 Tax=Galerina marginata (strain CBS 339.88) TaxID=685588 RepID=A0A067SEG5_GALM3|nr:hypothetical protein GALMADRAFT_145683 [Galerina marginata CBS 339.88]
MDPVDAPSSPSAPADPLSSSDSTADQIIDGVIGVLETLTKGSGVPFLEPAINLALGLVKLVQKTKQITSLYRKLAEDACNIVYCIYCECTILLAASKEIPMVLLRHVDKLMFTMKEIKAKCDEMVSRSWIYKALASSRDTAIVRRLRDDLNSALKIFNMESLISISQAVQYSAERLAQLQELNTAPVTVNNLSANVALNVTGRNVATLVNSGVAIINSGNTNYIQAGNYDVNGFGSAFEHGLDTIFSTSGQIEGDSVHSVTVWND